MLFVKLCYWIDWNSFRYDDNYHECKIVVE